MVRPKLFRVHFDRRVWGSKSTFCSQGDLWNQNTDFKTEDTDIKVLAFDRVYQSRFLEAHCIWTEMKYW